MYEVGFFDVETWSRLAETCGEYLTRGRGVRVVGRLKQDRWTNDDGQNRSRVRIVGEHVEFRSRPKGSDQEKAEESAAAEAAESSDKVVEKEPALTF